jgi:hypothetical protein
LRGRASYRQQHVYEDQKRKGPVPGVRQQRGGSENSSQQRGSGKNQDRAALEPAPQSFLRFWKEKTEDCCREQDQNSQLHGRKRSDALKRELLISGWQITARLAMRSVRSCAPAPRKPCAEGRFAFTKRQVQMIYSSSALIALCGFPCGHRQHTYPVTNLRGGAFLCSI